MNLKIRPGLLFDIDTISTFQIQMAYETENGLRLDPPTVTKGVAAVMDDPTKGKYWLAEADGVVVGCLLTVPEWSDWRNGTILWIHSVYVIPQARNQGVYRALYTYLKEMIESSSDFRGLRLYVDKTNKSAQRVYEKLGMDGTHYHLYEWMRS